MNALVIRRMNTLHTCKLAGDKNVYITLPRQRRPDEEEQKLIFDVMSCKGNTKALISKFYDERRKFITGMDIRNFLLKQRLSREGTEVEKLIGEMKKYQGSSILITELNSMVETIFFQTECMKKMYQEYPEILFIDSTYKINQNRMVLMVMMIMDGNGESGLAALSFLKSESEDCTRAALESFKKVSGNFCNETKTIMADKDMGIRKAFQSVS